MLFNHTFLLVVAPCISASLVVGPCALQGCWIKMLLLACCCALYSTNLPFIYAAGGGSNTGPSLLLHPSKHEPMKRIEEVFSVLLDGKLLLSCWNATYVLQLWRVCFFCCFTV
ncbi:hypothetical protein LR48_Vigan34s000100 [Vigna angularis]|uniref:Uncharacterized protein n=1 Tax=Phaseolus angularis TaxID=3914 RepID=A0A0L9T327_PHAAN|nr:hypothetical protein LR48_Vigan34s000100 [Vigna angularis]